MGNPKPIPEQRPSQFHLRSLFLVTVAVAIFFGLIGAGLSSRSNAAMFWYLAACGYVASGAVVMMARDVIVGRVSRLWSTGLLLSGILFAGVNIGVFATTVSVQQFTIFEAAYFWVMIIVIPAIAVVSVVLANLVTKRLDWLAVLGFSLWAACVAYTHHWVIMQCAASV